MIRDLQDIGLLGPLLVKKDGFKREKNDHRYEKRNAEIRKVASENSILKIMKDGSKKLYEKSFF